VNSVPTTLKLPVLALRGGAIREARVPRDGHRDRPAVEQNDGYGVIYDANILRKWCAGFSR
jgi:hypothetical protein